MAVIDHRQEIDQFEEQYRYDTTFMRELLETSPEGFAKFHAFLPLASHREKLSRESLWVAKLAAMKTEDCGHCLQLNVRLALEDEMPKPLIEAVLQGGEGLPDDLRDLYEYAVGVTANGPIPPALEERMHARFDKGQLLEIGLSIASAQVFPTIKRAVGYTKSCSLIAIEV